MTGTERLLFSFCIGIAVLAFALAALLDRVVDWPPFLGSYFGAIGFILIGAYIRNVKHKPRLALWLQGMGFYYAFTALCAVMIFTLLPLPFPMVDAFLNDVGHWFGYDWRGFVAFMVGYPWITSALGVVYHSAIPQMMLTVFVLAWYGRSVELYRYLLVGMISFLITVAIWWRWPSVGYVGVLPYTPEEMLAAGLQFSANKGEQLTHLLQEGTKIITPGVIAGVVGFPSYHMIMALMVTWSCRRTIVFPLVVAVNLAMIPATLLHGGHHLADLAGGLVVFILCVLIANRLIRPENSPPGELI